MVIQMQDKAHGRSLVIRARGRLKREDYQRLILVIKRLVEQHGTISILLDMEDCHGWTGSPPGAAVQFEMKYFCQVNQLAFVGDEAWEPWMAGFGHLFPMAQIRCYGRNTAAEAKTWIRADLADAQVLGPSTS